MLTGSEVKRAVVLPDARQRQQRVKLIGCLVTVRGPPGGEEVRGKGGVRVCEIKLGIARSCSAGGDGRNYWQDLLGDRFSPGNRCSAGVLGETGNMLGGQGLNWESTLVHVFVRV